MGAIGRFLGLAWRSVARPADRWLVLRLERLGPASGRTAVADDTGLVAVNPVPLVLDDRVLPEAWRIVK